LTPPLPSTLGASVSGVPSFFIDSFSIPPFLLPIYQAAGAAYGIPWQVLAAINEVETDYGRDLNVSSAGAEGWMQFLPSEWGQYGVDVNDDGFEDPYNPADAIFAAARYLQTAGGDTDIRAAVFSYNHSQAYVNSVMLRARLLGGTPPELLGAITGLTEARFPVYASAHYSDGFPTTEGVSPKAVAGTTIYSEAGAPVIAVQDGTIVQISQFGPLGRSISLRDAYGNTYTYSELGTLATLYPVLEALEPQDTHASSTTSPESGASSSTAASLGSFASASATSTSGASSTPATRVFRAGSDNVYLHPLRVGVQVIAGTVLGHVGSGLQPHIVFQIRPSGPGTPLIDPKPILDSWVKLQSTSVVKVTGLDPFATISPTPGQALLESKTQLEQQVPRERGIRLASCVRRLIEDGQVDRRVLAALVFLSVSGLRPTVSGRGCPRASSGALRAASQGAAGNAFDISAVNGIPVAGPNGSASLAVAAVHKLLGLQGAMKPLQIESPVHVAGAVETISPSTDDGVIHVAFQPLAGGNARVAGAFNLGLSPRQWVALIARLGEVPDPVVSAKPSSAAIPDRPGPDSSTPVEGN
jgi:murein DD-endopeptidase MepM/ murein hydrolase activator NlpD